MRLIDADAIHSTLADWQLMLSETYGTNDEFVRCLEDVLYTVDNTPTIAASPWHRVEEPPKKTAKYLVWVDVNNGVFSAYPELRTAAYNVVYERWYVDGDQRTEWIGTPRYWMPIEPPKEDA